MTELERCGTAACPLCVSCLPSPGSRLQHWIGHTAEIEGGGYTWTCHCGPSVMYWEDDYQAAAGLAIHMLDMHHIPL